MAYLDEVLADGALLLWFFGETSGTVLEDFIGATDGVYFNDPALATTPGPSATCDRANFAPFSPDFESFSTDSPFVVPTPIPAGDFWVEIWQNTTNPVGTIDMGVRLSGAHRVDLFGVSGTTNTRTQVIGPGGTATVTVPLVAPGWHQLVVSVAIASGITFFIDGVSVGSDAVAVGQPGATSILGLFATGSGGTVSFGAVTYGPGTLSASRAAAHFANPPDCAQEPPPPTPIPGYLTGGGLGCGENQAFLADRNGRLLVKLPFSELSYGRRLDDLSEASVSLGVGGRTGEVCCDVLSRLRPWEHLLIVYRDTGEVWVGIVAEPHYTPTEVKLSARDLFQVFERRVLPFDRDFYYEDLSDIFRQYALDALSRDNSYGITVSASDSGQVGSRSVRTIEYRRAADELRELAKIGVDFTMRGRQLIATGEQTVPSFKLITSDFVNQEIGIGGLQTATEVIVKGAQAEDGSQPIGVAGGVDPTLGLVQLVIEEDSITDQASAQFAAEAYLALLQEPPTVVSGILDGRASVEFSDLVPGRVCDLRVESGCRRVIADMRLSEVSVSVSVGDEGTTESVGVTFVPVTLGQEE